jgi:type I restriction enzyme, S subunit
VKEGWISKRFGDVCEYDKTQAVDRTLPYVGLEHIESNTARFIGSFEPKLIKSSTFSFSYDHVLYGRLRPYLNKVLAPDFEGHCSTEIFPVKPGPELLREYLLYWFLSDETVDRINATCTGARMPRANMNSVLEFDFPYPPLPEQQRIVAILDEAFEGIATARANAEKNLQNARALFESHLHDVFTQHGQGWVENRLRDIARINYGYTESASWEAVGPKFLRITDIQDSRVEWSDVPYCPIEPSVLPKYKLADGDIVFARTGATTGKSYLVTKPPEAVFASYLIRVQLNTKELLPQFVNLFFQTHGYWECIRSGVSGSAQGGFNATKLGELVIPFPKLEGEQEKIVAELDALTEETQHLETIYQKKLAALDELKKSLLHQAFSGEL